MTEFQIRIQQISRYLLAGAVVLLAAVPFIWAPGSLFLPLGRDQGIFAWVGGVILSGGLPYADAWEVKGPLSHFEKHLVRSLREFDFNDVVAEELRHSAVAKLIEEQGYKVLRVPGKNNQRDDAHRRLYPAFNYVNVILSGQWALVPYFGIPALDESAYALYRQLGYDVTPMPSASYSLRLGGGIRCMSTTFRKTQ